MELRIWNEWKQRCAAVKCDETSRAELYQRGAIWAGLISKENGWAAQWFRSEKLRESESFAWTVFETYMLCDRDRSKPVWKRHMFARFERNSNAQTDAHRAATLNSYGFACFRSALNRYLDTETNRQADLRGIRIVPGDQKHDSGADQGGAGVSIFDRYVDDAQNARDCAADNELRALCSDSFIESLFERLNGRQRIVFLAVGRGLRLSNPCLFKPEIQLVHGAAADSSLYEAKSVIAKILENEVIQTLTASKNSMVTLCVHDIRAFSKLALSMLSRRCAEWGASQPWWGGLSNP
jgi:hypothetical protein